jgi:hypothetical protein
MERKSTMETRIATCRCGQASARLAGDPIRVSVCHCLECKRRTGSAFSWNATWPEEALRLEGSVRRFTRNGDSGQPIDYDFCSDCGSTIVYRLAMRPGAVSIPAGAFADPGFPPPYVEVYRERRASWCALEIAHPDAPR